MRNRTQHSLALCLALLIATATGGSASAFDGHCAHCGCKCQCDQTCRLVREEKKVDIVCWGMTCEDFCQPGCGKVCEKHCEEVCEDCDKPCDPSVPCTPPQKFVWYEWIPGCSKGIQTKRKLMKKTITKKIPSYKWVVEDLCPACVGKCQCAQVETDAQIPAVPPAAKHLPYTVKLPNVEIIPTSLQSK